MLTTSIIAAGVAARAEQVTALPRRIVAAVGRVRLLPVAILALATFAVTQLTGEDKGSTGAPALTAPASFFGLGFAGSPSTTDLARVNSAGVKVVRLTFDWRTFQPTGAAPPRFDAVDPIIRTLAEAHVRAFPGFVGTPGWLAPDPTTAPLFSSAARSAWGAFLAAAVQRYGPNGSFWSENPSVPYEPIRAWQIWNEENAVGYFGPRPSPSAYAELLHISAAAIRGADPGATIVTGGMFQTVGRGGSILSWRFLRGLYRAGGAPDFDAVGVHPYDPDIAGMARQVKRIRAVMDAAGRPGTPIWIDELGWGSGATGSKLNLGPEGQAAMLSQAFDYVLANRKELGIEHLMWYPLRDPPAVANNPCGFCDSAGLLEATGAPKPAWAAFRSYVASSQPIPTAKPPL